MVFDKQGRFVDGLKREQFELVIDGKPQPIAFFEQVRAGSAQEEARLSAGRPQAPSNAAATDNRVANTTAVQQTKITVE